MHGKRVRAQRGLSPVIASVLLVLIVASLGSVLFLYANSSVQIYASNTGAFLSRSSDTLKERFAIEYVRFESSTLNVTVRNVGRLDIRVVALYLLDATDGRILLASTGVTSLVNVGLFTSFTIPYGSFVPQSGTTYQVSIVTDRGSRVTENWKA